VGPIKLESSELADRFLEFNPSHFFFLSIYLTPNKNHFLIKKILIVQNMIYTRCTIPNKIF
ncbi:hypothetical protein, partial [Bacillus thuringiensis]|uniref:hypothetical protein n=1 Tax=Bacillus thuringiensis TaxID=1428 RepID=UPI001C3F2A7B